MTFSSNKIIIYTDGACSGNPGPGGWGAILLYREHKKEINGFVDNTTNNRMELTAVIKSLEIIKDHNLNIEIYTDSSYIKNGITSWIFNWKSNDWKNKKKQAVKNIELWKKLDFLSSKHKIAWNWVKSHSGNHYNEIADQLAKSAIKKNI